MKKFTLGQNLLVVYGIVIIICILKTGFQVGNGLTWVSYPTLALLKNSQSFMVPIFNSVGYIGVAVIVTILQGVVLYYGGNWLGKVLKKS